MRPPEAGLCRSVCDLGFAFKDSGDLANAVESFSQALRVKPDYAKAIWNLGMVYVELEEFENAMEQYTPLLAVDRANAAKLHAAIVAAKRSHSKEP